LFNGLFLSSASTVEQQKGKPFRILIQQEMIGWQWQQVDNTQTIGTLLHKGNHASTLPPNFLAE